MTNPESRKPCPFCGSSDLEAQCKPDPSPPSYPDGVWVIECFGCGALGPFCEEHQNAVKAWNDRDAAEPTPALTYSQACDLLARYAVALQDRQCCGDAFQPQYLEALKACTDAMGAQPERTND